MKLSFKFLIIKWKFLDNAKSVHTEMEVQCQINEIKLNFYDLRMVRILHDFVFRVSLMMIT